MNDIRTQQTQQRQVAPADTRQMTEAQRTAAGVLADGTQRVRSFGAPVLRMQTAKIDGYEQRWVNDHPGRIEQLKAQGWEHVTKGGQKVEQVVGTAPTGGPLIAYLLKIKEEWYKEDFAAFESAEAAKMQEIRAGKLHVSPETGHYVPQQGIKIDRR